MEKTGPTVCYSNRKENMEEMFFNPVFTALQQREPFKRRWFTLSLMNRKLLYFKTPLVSVV